MVILLSKSGGADGASSVLANRLLLKFGGSLESLSTSLPVSIQENVEYIVIRRA